MADRRGAWGVLAVLAAFLAACATQVTLPPEVAKQRPADFPDAYYRALAAQGSPVFEIDPARSLVVVEVRRGGSLAQFGHDHVVASHDVNGYVASGGGRADLYVPLEALVVDEAALRTEAGFDTQPSPEDIAGTRRNMLDKVLEADRYPTASIAVRDIAAGSSPQALRATITLHGVSRVVETVVEVEGAADEMLVKGAFAMDLSAFGIAPFSVLGGAIAVQDRVNFRFRLRAVRRQ